MTDRARPRTLYVKQLSELAAGRMADEGHRLPRTRGDCLDGPRPCPYVSCKYNMYLDVSSITGSIKLNFPDVEPDGMPAGKSCLLDIVAAGPLTLEEISQAMNISREGVRKIELGALAKLQVDSPERDALAEYAGDLGRAEPTEYTLESDSGDRIGVSPMPAEYAETHPAETNDYGRVLGFMVR